MLVAIMSLAMLLIIINGVGAVTLGIDEYLKLVGSHKYETLGFRDVPVDELQWEV